MAEIKHATDETYMDLVLNNEKPVLVDFWAGWCQPCKMVAPEIEKAAEKYDGVIEVVKIDVDANPRASQHFNVLSIPFIAFFPGGGRQPMGRPGFRPLDVLEREFGLAEYAPVSAD